MHNFNRIGKAFICVFALIIGDSWNNKLAEYVLAGQEELGMVGQIISWTYFILVMLVGHIVMMALVTALLLKNFEQSVGSELQKKYEVKDRRKAQRRLTGDENKLKKKKKPVCSCEFFQKALKKLSKLFNRTFSGNKAALNRDKLQK